MTCDHAPGADPRLAGACVKCGRPIVVPGSRDPAYEREFLRQVEATAARQGGVNPEGFSERVLKRLAIGAEAYGDLDYLAKDLMAEFQSEAEDMAAYALLAAQKALADTSEPEGDMLWHLLEASRLAAEAWCHARQARRR